MRSHNTSGHNGINWHKGSRKWMVRVGNGKGLKYIGSYKDINDAVAARAKAQEGMGYTERHGRNGGLVRGVLA